MASLPLAFMQPILVLTLVDVLQAGDVVPAWHTHTEVHGDGALQEQTQPGWWQQGWHATCVSKYALKSMQAMSQVERRQKKGEQGMWIFWGRGAEQGAVKSELLACVLHMYMAPDCV